MHKLPLPHNEKARLRALHNYDILDSLNEPEFDRITELASIICDVPISLITLIDEKRQWFKSAKGIAGTETSRDVAFCRYTIMDTAILEVEDATKDDRFKENEFVPLNLRYRILSSLYSFFYYKTNIALLDVDKN